MVIKRNKGEYLLVEGRTKVFYLNGKINLFFLRSGPNAIQSESTSLQYEGFENILQLETVRQCLISVLIFTLN